ncbi:MAG TPA: hypothetical protein PKZ27_13130 [Rhodocyclaceae bacterium]|nr:hypothetical protein [Rhodocyclaceae bacterium]
MAAGVPPGATARAVLNDMLWLLPPLAVLVAVGLAGRSMNDGAFLIVTLAIAVTIMVGLGVRSRVRRGMLLASCIETESPWHRRLRGTLLLWLLALVRAVPLALILAVALARAAHPLTLVIFVLSAPGFVLLWRFCMVRMSTHVLPRFLPDIALRIAQFVALAMLVTGLSLAALFAAYPDLSDLSLGQAIVHEVRAQDADSAVLLALMQFAAGKDVVAWWLGQQLLPGLVEPVFQLAAWAIVLATDVLVVWSYLVFCSSVLCLAHWRSFNQVMETERTS